VATVCQVRCGFEVGQAEQRGTDWSRGSAEKRIQLSGQVCKHVTATKKDQAERDSRRWTSSTGRKNDRFTVSQSGPFGRPVRKGFFLRALTPQTIPGSCTHCCATALAIDRFSLLYGRRSQDSITIANSAVTWEINREFDSVESPSGGPCR